MQKQITKQSCQSLLKEEAIWGIFPLNQNKRTPFRIVPSIHNLLPSTKLIVDSHTN